MSGGTWDYADRRLTLLAEEVREGRARWLGEDEEPVDLKCAREAMAGMLDLTSTLLGELDYHFAGDSYIEDEAVWLLNAGMRYLMALDAFRPR